MIFQLKRTFLWTLKIDGASLKLPMDVGQFYASHLLKKLPAGLKIDLKKTKFKKFTNFLKMFNEETGDVVKVSSKKGLDSIQEVA